MDGPLATSPEDPGAGPIRLNEPGARTGRRLNWLPRVVSRYSVTLPSEKLVEPCVAAIQQFLEILDRRPDDATRYEWANIRLEGLELSLDVHWYDLDFYERRKNAFRFGPHPLAFQRFGVTPDDFRVRHIEG